MDRDTLMTRETYQVILNSQYDLKKIRIED